MGIFSNQVDASALVAGDHIYSYRKSWGYLYAHHGIYVEEDRVVHFMGDPGLMIMVSGSGSLSPLCDGCGFDGMRVGVLASCLNCFLKGGKLRRFGYGVSRAERVAAIRAGCCSMELSHAADVVNSRALHFLGKGTFGPYHVLHNNCLHFAFYCKTGLVDVYKPELLEGHQILRPPSTKKKKKKKQKNQKGSGPGPVAPAPAPAAAIVRRQVSVSRVEHVIAATVPHRSSFALVLLGTALRAFACCFLGSGPGPGHGDSDGPAADGDSCRPPAGPAPLKLASDADLALVPVSVLSTLVVCTHHAPHHHLHQC